MNDFVGSRLKMKRRILIVDDEEINRALLNEVLKDDYEVLLASNGQEALDIIELEEGRLSLVLLDLLMPVMDGYDFFEKMKKDESFSRIPVICLTSEKEAEVKSLKMGMADFISKPYDMPEVIKARIARIIQLYEDRNIISATQFDMLTGLFNREYFYEYSNIYDHFYPDNAKDVIAVNLNRFHIINAVYGRDFGNRVLKAVGETIKEYSHANQGVACRYNADSYYIYIKSGEHEKVLYERIAGSIKGFVDDYDIRIRIGVYKDADTGLDFGKRLDYALLACNSINGNYNKKIAYYDDKIREKEHFEAKLIHDLDKALAERQFKVFFQPKYNVEGEQPRLCSAEALIRWEHPELGMISPGVFIPLFENKGLIGKVDRYVWEETAAKVAQWKKSFHHSIPVSVNVSRVDMLNENLCSDIKKIVDNSGIDVKDFYLEVTESAYTENRKDVLSIVKDFRREGFTIEMDDFGTGYSSLNMLTEMPFDVLKLDMAFVKNIHTDEKALRLVEFIMDIARYLNVSVIAEGVEYKEQYDLLKKMGCNVIQGYYFSKPLCCDEFENLLKQLQEMCDAY
ncbi:MAG: EAL domain-containing protein [Lachnospiraceae bacterium]|nr:EAL domain-containing protein [Lachnospiraceae bacterium]